MDTKIEPIVVNEHGVTEFHFNHNMFITVTGKQLNIIETLEDGDTTGHIFELTKEQKIELARQLLLDTE